MIKIKYLVLTLLVLTSFWSCQSTLDKENEQGVQIRLNVETNSADNIFSVSSKAAYGSDPVYALEIYNSAGQLVASYEQSTMIDDLRLKAGTYKFVVFSGVDNELATLDAPYYYGEKSVTVVGGVENQISMTAKQKNVKITADFAQIIKDEDLFSDYSFTIDEVVLTKELIASGSGIYNSSKTTELEWRVSVINVQGVKSEVKGTLLDVKPSSHYKFFFDVKEAGSDEDGALNLNLTVDTSLEVFNDIIDVNLEAQPLPVFKSYGFTLDKQQIIKEQSRDDLVMQLEVFAPNQTKEITLRHTSEYLLSLGLPYTLELSTSEAESLRESIKTGVGVEWSSPIVGNSRPMIDFSKLAQKAPLGAYKIYVTFVDSKDQLVETTFQFSVLPEQDHMILSVDHGAKYAVFYGEWCTLVKPEDLSFEYRVVGADSWTVVPVDNIEITSTANKKYQTRVIGLLPSTKYEVRTYGNGFEFAEDGIWQKFTTDPAPEIPNLSFDDWHKSGDNYYPNAENGNSFWASGNEGVTGFGVGKDPNTVPTDHAVKGKAVRMFTYTGITLVGVAAGNVYTGTYKTNMGNPKASAVFGRPYTGRPLGLKGYYQYSPQMISSTESDMCHIYISLEDWGGATSRPSNPTLIGYGEFKSDQLSTEYQQFEIVIDYKSDAIPTHVSIAATSSHKGGDFIGAKNSELYVDEFELVWE